MTLPEDTLVVSETASERSPPLNVDPSRPPRVVRDSPFMTLGLVFCVVAVAVLYRYCMP